jgi:hypothetical protein
VQNAGFAAGTDDQQNLAIKGVPPGTRKAITDAAKQEGLTIAEWLERRVAEWEAAGRFTQP